MLISNVWHLKKIFIIQDVNSILYKHPRKCISNDASSLATSKNVNLECKKGKGKKLPSFRLPRKGRRYQSSSITTRNSLKIAFKYFKHFHGYTEIRGSSGIYSSELLRDSEQGFSYLIHLLRVQTRKRWLVQISWGSLTDRLHPRCRILVNATIGRRFVPRLRDPPSRAENHDGQLTSACFLNPRLALHDLKEEWRLVPFCYQDGGLLTLAVKSVVSRHVGLISSGANWVN